MLQRIHSSIKLTNISSIFQKKIKYFKFQIQRKKLLNHKLAETKEIFTKKINQRDSRKKYFNKSISLEYCRERITQYIEKAEFMGISLPSTLALNPYNC